MSFIIYIFLFMMINRLMYMNPTLGMLLYIGLILLVVTRNRKRMQSFRQQSSYQSNQQYYQNQNQSQRNYQDDPRVKGAIDIEFSEEEIQ